MTSVALLPLFRDLPLAVLGAIVIGAVLGFLNVPELRRVYGLRRDAFLLAIVALVAVVILNVLPGLLLAVALSILLLLNRASRPQSAVLGNLPGTTAFADVEQHPEAITSPGLLIFRLNSPLLFVNASWMRDHLHERIEQAEPSPRVVLLDLQFSSDLDIRGLDILNRIAEDLHTEGIELWLANVHAGARAMLQRGDHKNASDLPRLHLTVAEAVNQFRTGVSSEQVKSST